ARLPRALVVGQARGALGARCDRRRRLPLRREPLSGAHLPLRAARGAAPAALDRDALGRRVARDSRAGRRARAAARAARGRLLPPRAPAVGRAPGAARASPPRLSGTRLPPPARARPGAPCPPARPARALHPAGRSRGDAAQARPSPRPPPLGADPGRVRDRADRKSTRLNSSHVSISYAVFCLKK